MIVAAPPSATEIYDRARAAVLARPRPAFIAFRQDETFVRKGKTTSLHQRVIVRMADGATFVTSIPDSPRDRVDAAPTIGHVELYPTTTFGLVRRRVGEMPSKFERPEPAATPAPAASEPAVIGHVETVARDYDATLAGVESLDGVPVYHLHMTPRFDPEHHPIRELYVDETTYQPRRIVINFEAAIGPARTRPTVVVDYAETGDVWLVSHATVEAVLRFLFLAYGGSGDYRLSDASFPASEPDWMFDKKLYENHMKHPEASPTP